MMAGVRPKGVCQHARKHQQAERLRGKDPGRASRRATSIPPSDSGGVHLQRVSISTEDVMSGFNLAASSKEEQDKVAVDLMASGVAYKVRLAMPVVAELVAREQPEHLRERPEQQAAP